MAADARNIFFPRISRFRLPLPWWEAALWLALLALAVFTRFAGLGDRVLSYDENLHAIASWDLSQGLGYAYTPITHGPFQFFLIALTYLIGGVSEATSRIPAAAFGVAAVLLPLAFRRWIGRAGALAAGILMTLSPYMMYYSRYARNESFVVVWGLLAFWFLARYLETNKRGWLFGWIAVNALHFATKETAFIYAALELGFLALWVWRDWANRPWSEPRRQRRFFAASTAGLVLAVSAAGLLVAGRAQLMQAAVARGEPARPELMIHTAMPVTNPAVLAGLALAVLSTAALVWMVLLVRKDTGSEHLRHANPAFSALLVLGTLVLIQMSALPMALFNLNPFDGDPVVRIQDAGYLLQSGLCILPLWLLSAGIGLGWNWKRWTACAAIFYGIYVVLYSSFLTYPEGLAVSLVGSLNYWLAQQTVHRGGQPSYYYWLIQIPLYEFLPVVLCLCAPLILLVDKLRKRRGAASVASASPAFVPESSAENPELPKTGFPMLGFLFFWAAGSLVAFSLAGEKMPWLTVHIILPFILLAGWTIGRLAAAFGKSSPLGAGAAAVARAAGGMASIAVVLLAIATFRAAYRASFIQSNDPREFLIYAQFAPDVRTIALEIERLAPSSMIHGTTPVIVDEQTIWSYKWYLRGKYKLEKWAEMAPADRERAPVLILAAAHWQEASVTLADTHVMSESTRIWWPIMDYFDLDASRIRFAFTDSAWRDALWRIWWDRDYSAYGRLTGKSYGLDRWPVVDRMRLYVRTDLADTPWIDNSGANGAGG